MSKNRKRFKHSTSVFVILRQDDKILWLRRAATGWMDNHYSLPAGGVDGGEPLKVAAAREAKEEICVKIKPEDLAFCHLLHSNTNGDEWMGVFFETTQWEGTPKIGEPNKHADLVWATVKDVPGKCVPYVEEAVNKIDKANLYTEYGWM